MVHDVIAALPAALHAGGVVVDDSQGVAQLVGEGVRHCQAVVLVHDARAAGLADGAELS